MMFHQAQFQSPALTKLTSICFFLTLPVCYRCYRCYNNTKGAYNGGGTPGHFFTGVTPVTSIQDETDL